MEDGCEIDINKIESTLQIVSKKWTVMIIKLIYEYENPRYTDISKRLIGISPKTLSDRLRELAELKIVKRESFAEIPPRVEYSLTEKGLELGKSIQPIVVWSDKWSTK